MTQEQLLQAIADNFLCVRRLPFETVTYWTYTEGDENRKWVDANGNPSTAVRSVVIQDYDLAYYEKQERPKWSKQTPLERYNQWKKLYPNGQKLLKEVRTVDKGGWWYVKQVTNTDSTVRFNREYDKFFAPTLEEAVQLFLQSK